MDNIIENFKKKLFGIITDFKEDMKGVQTDRPSVAMVENIKVEYYDSKTPLNHLASIQVKPPQEIQIQVWDKEMIKSVADAIESSDLGFSVNIDGKIIRAFAPELSKERREEIVRHIKKIIEEYKIQIRSLRNEVNKEIDNKVEAGEATEDDKFRLKENTQEETNKTNKEIDQFFQKKKEKIENN